MRCKEAVSSVVVNAAFQQDQGKALFACEGLNPLKNTPSYAQASVLSCYDKIMQNQVWLKC